MKLRQRSLEKTWLTVVRVSSSESTSISRRTSSPRSIEFLTGNLRSSRRLILGASFGAKWHFFTYTEQNGFAFTYGNKTGPDFIVLSIHVLFSRNVILVCRRLVIFGRMLTAISSNSVYYSTYFKIGDWCESVVRMHNNFLLVDDDAFLEEGTVERQRFVFPAYHWTNGHERNDRTENLKILSHR